MQQEFVSVIIPTFCDWERLTLCLNALERQTYPQECFEIIVVNNEPKDPPPANYRIPANCRILTEPRPGSYAARNTGLRASKGSIIGFTDSDCIPVKEWISNAVSYLHQHPECSRIAGKLSIIYQQKKPTVAELYNTLFAFPQQIHVENNGSSVTGNLFTYRKVFDAVGMFNDAMLSLGDLDWGKKAHQGGFAVHYVPEVMVWHPARDLKELVKKEKRVGGGQATGKKSSKARMFLDFLADNRPRKYIFGFVYKYGKELNLVEKAKVVALRHYLLSIRAYERWKVQSGKAPNRA